MPAPWSVCIVRQEGTSLLHRHMQAAPAPFLKAVAPYRDGLVVAVECLCTWEWLADRWADQGMPCVLGPARSMQASHGGQATNDQSDAHKMAALLRGGMLPQAYVSPAQMRATRARLRRRPPLRRQRAALLAHVHNTNSQDNRPEIGKKIADTANRDGVAERLDEAAVQQTIAGDLARITYDAELRKALELSLLKPAQQHDAHTLSRLQPVPGVGKILRLVRRYEIQDIRRCPTVQDFASYSRLVKCSQESGGKRLGPSGKTIGNAPLTGALSEAATLFLQNTPQGQTLLSRLEQKHAQGKARTILAHQRGRAVYFMRQRQVAVARDICFQTSGSSAGEPSVSLDTTGRSLQ